MLQPQNIGKVNVAHCVTFKGKINSTAITQMYLKMCAAQLLHAEEYNEDKLLGNKVVSDGTLWTMSVIHQ